MTRYAFTVGAFALLVLSSAADAQGLVGGARRGAAVGNHALGPIGAVVGGAVGPGIGTVNGALGIHPRRWHWHHRCYYRHGVRHCH